MMVIKGNGGEGKSQIGAVLGALFGSNMKDGSIGKISENRFARADLEHILLCVDDDMRMEALRQTNYVKSIVTAQGKIDLERKGKQSYQGWMFARLLAFSNGDLQALYDRSDGFYRRQLVLTTKEKPAGRVDDPDLAEKMKAEVEGIFLWAFEGLQRLAANNFKFTESQRTRDNREAVKRDNNNVFDFLESEGYIRLKADCTISSKDLYEIYRMWCEENNLTPLKRRSFSESVIANQSKYNLEYCNKITNAAGRRVWGFFGIEAIARPNINGFSDVSEHTYVWEHFSRILCFKCCPLWQKTSAPISDSGKQRVSRQQRRGVCALGDHHAPCRITFMLFIRGGVPGKLPAQQPQKSVVCPLRPFATGQKSTKKPNYCK